MAAYLLIGIMLFVFLQDLKLKAVYWFVFPVILGFSLWYSWNHLDWKQLAWNVGVLVVLMSGLTLYLTFKNRRLINPFDGFFAWGDILFLLAVSPLFNTQTFLFYFITGTVFVLLVHGVLTLLKKTDREIPFAGYMAFYLGGLILFADLYDIPLI
ncbi:MAG: hypothetical protein K0R65_2753 [Crocinitomicaceae bacterium]|jgi:hypothetical protein|nr:hypothetical protein [Crocinitomicaceae bacterium]